MRTEILQIPSDDFKSRMKQVISYFNNLILEEEYLKEVIYIWSEGIKQDEEAVNKKCVKKMESM